MHQAKLYPDFDPKTQIMIMAAAYGLGVGVTGGGGSGGDVVEREVKERKSGLRKWT